DRLRGRRSRGIGVPGEARPRRLRGCRRRANARLRGGRCARDAGARRHRRRRHRRRRGWQVHECVRAGAQAAPGMSKDDTRPDLPRRRAAGAVGWAFLLATVVGSGIMGERLAAGNVAVALLANPLATGAALVALILTFGPISGAHFNPAVTLVDAW